MNLYAIMAVYNKCVSDSLSYQSVLKHPEIQLIVCDNSTKEFHNKEIVEKDGYTYVSMHGNAGLSKAYNAALDSISKKEGYVILMDDDTNFSDHYYACLQSSLQDGDIYLPIVTCDSGMLSPCRIKNGIVSIAKSLPIPKSEMSAINSGMCISLRLFENYRYDERLFLDYVDHKFMNDFRDAKIEILDTKIIQEFSSDVNSKESAKIRFKIFIRDSKFFYLDYLKKKWSFAFVVTKRKIRLCLQYKDLWFLKGGE